MANKKQKVDPPGFLDFLVDPAKGLFSPLSSILWSVFNGFTQLPAVGNIKSGVDSQMISKVAEVKPPFKGSPEWIYPEIGDYVEDKDALAVAVWESGFNWVALGSAIPFLDLEQAVYYAMMDPRNRILMDISYEYRKSYWDIICKPVITRALFKYKPVLVPEPFRLADMHAKGWLDYFAYIDAMKQNGFDENWARAWANTQAVYPSPDVILQLLRRGVVRDEVAVEWLRHQGYRSDVLGVFWALKDVIPPINDLIRFAVREAFPVAAGKPQFDEMKKWARMQGLTDYWVDRYWLAHFDRMPLSIAYRNVHRGFFNWEQFEHYLLLADIHPDDWEAIKRVAFEVPSLRELGYGFDVGVYSYDDIKKYRRWAGLSPEDAEKSAAAMVAYRTEAEREAVRRELLYLFSLGHISRAEFETELKNLGTNPYAIPLWIKRGELLARRRQTESGVNEPKTITRSDAQWLFEYGLRNEDWLRRVLKFLGYSDDAINAYVDQSKARIIERAKPAPVKKPRSLSISQLTRLTKAGKISPTELPSRLMAADYSKSDAEAIAQTIIEEVEKKPPYKQLSRAEVGKLYVFGVYKVADLYNWFLSQNYSPQDAQNLAVITAAEELLPKLSALYRNGWITAATIKDELIRTGLTSDMANLLTMTVVKAEQPARLAPERDLTKSEIVKGVKNGIIGINEGVQLLQSIGYDEWEARYILAISGVVAAGDPEGYWEMRKVAELYKKATGQPFVEIPDELISLERQLRDLRKQYDEAKKKMEAEEKIAELKLKIDSIESQMRTIIGKLKLS